LHGKFCNGREVSAGKSLISDFTQLFEIDNTINGKKGASRNGCIFSVYLLVRCVQILVLENIHLFYMKCN